jgi:hypothetical protein
METDPAQLAVALELPEGVTLPEGAAFIAISATQSKLGKTSDRKYFLKKHPAGEGRSIYKIAQSDLPIIRRQQALISGWEDADPDASSGSFSVGLNGCRTGDGPQPNGIVNISLQTSPDGAFVPLIRNMPWSQVVEETDLPELPHC